MILKIAVCDDEPSMVEEIKGLISKAGEALQVPYTAEYFLSGEDLIKQLNKGGSYDLIYLDISMKKLSGIDVGKYVREQLLNRRTLLIFISSYEERAKELFECWTFRFLVKPIDQEKFTEYFCSACQYLGFEGQKYLEFKEIKGELTSVPFKDIVYLESTGRTIQLVTLKERYFFYGKLKEVVPKFTGSDFIRIHNSILVNFDFISLIRYDSVVLKNGETKDISGPKRKTVREAYSEMRRRREI